MIPSVLWCALTRRWFIAETRIPLPAESGQPERFDYEYERNGTRNLFVYFQPLAGLCPIEMMEHRTKTDFAHCMRYLVDGCFPDAEVVRVVTDHLNTHLPASLYEAFGSAGVSLHTDT
jgi:hypothetical protein